ncbi:MAG: cation transporter [Candidatus Kerfeldbacteria bacterium]|nr:cation transporter [Candidatus Kerfeldbacteria bacterium]
MSRHHHHDDERGGHRLFLALAIVLLVMAIEIVGGLASGSMALLSDAGHMATDAFALGMSALAIWIGKRPPDARHTYGYRHWEVLAALVNGMVLAGVVAAIVVNALGRIVSPRPVAGNLMTLVAFIGLLANLAMFRVLLPVRHTTTNLRSAFLHVLADGLSSVGVMIAGIVILTTGWMLADPFISLAIAVLIAWQVARLIADSVRQLLAGAPRHLDAHAVASAIRSVPHVTEVHDLHLTMPSPQIVLTAHVVLDVQTLKEGIATCAAIRAMLHGRYHIHHATIQIDDPSTLNPDVSAKLFCMEDEPHTKPASQDEP